MTNFSNLDPLYVLNSPKPLAKTLSRPLWTTLTATLATRLETSVSVIRKIIPLQFPFVQYGRARQLDGGDIIHARELIPLQTDSRDMSFVRVRKHDTQWLLNNIDLFIYLIQYQLAVDKFAHRPRQAPQFELQDFFGQVLRFIVVNIPLSLDHGIEAQSLVYAVIDEVKVLDQGSRTNLYRFYQATGPIVTIDLNQVQCVIGRILDRGKWAIVDRSTSVAQIHTS